MGVYHHRRRQRRGSRKSPPTSCSTRWKTWTTTTTCSELRRRARGRTLAPPRTTRPTRKPSNISDRSVAFSSIYCCILQQTPQQNSLSYFLSMLFVAVLLWIKIEEFLLSIYILSAAVLIMNDRFGFKLLTQFTGCQYQVRTWRTLKKGVNDFAFVVGTRVEKETNQLSLILWLQLEYGMVPSSISLHLSPSRPNH